MSDVVLDSEMLTLSGQLATLTQQVALLNGQVALLVDRAEQQEMRRESWTDLQADAQPIVGELYDLMVDQFSDLQQDVTLDDILHLLRRMIRNVRTFDALLDQLDSAQDFMADFSPIVSELYDVTVSEMTTLDERGYFAFARQVGYIVDRIVTAYSEEDVRQLGDNIVLILDTVKSMTQPEIMELLGKLGSNLQEVERHSDELPTNTLALLRQMRDPDVRRGLAVALATLKATGRNEE